MQARGEAKPSMVTSLLEHASDEDASNAAGIAYAGAWLDGFF